MFCSNIARLPSTGREAFLSVVALRILPQAIRSCSFVDLGLILQSMSTCDISLTRDVVILCQNRLGEVAKEQVAHLVQHKHSEIANSIAAALERIAESSLKILPNADGQQLLASIRPLTLELFACKALRFRTAAALLLMHSHFRIRDVELFDGIVAESDHISPVLAGRLLRGMAPLGHPVKSVMLAIDQSFGSHTWQRSLPALTADLFAAALLDFKYLSEETVNALFQAAKVHCANPDLNLPAPLRLKCAGELSASSHAWLHQVGRWIDESPTGPERSHDTPFSKGVLKMFFRTSPDGICDRSLQIILMVWSFLFFFFGSGNFNHQPTLLRINIHSLLQHRRSFPYTEKAKNTGDATWCADWAEEARIL